MKQSYKDYHDILILDTTFKTNRFNMPLVLIVGIDNNGKNIIIGFALISKDDSESYEWIFN